ncbi:MAG: DegT/DnrJ/EryC1/StrS family aminotransferase [Chloroflexi bacterium]|nr:DegT/DnrJ/EryC1/StrS family aminotransferase [Chloroflexota bacterium]
MIPVSEPSLAGNEKQYVLDCLESSWISSSGKYIKPFEEAFASYVGTKHAVAVSNGTVALHLALLALGVGPGDEVIVPTFTYIATANAVTYVGATPVLVDCEPDTWCMSAEDFAAKITPRTKAVIPVHLYGHPCDMDPIRAPADRKGIAVIEDAAEAIGTKYKGKMAGSIGNMATFSFYGNKTITTGEGGMVVCDDDELAGAVRLYKGQGMSRTKRYWFDVVGYNYRMTNIQAAIGLAQLERVDSYVAKKRENAANYTELLEGIEGLVLPTEREYAINSYWMYSVLIDDNFGMGRDDVMRELEVKGIETRPFFYPMHVMPPYRYHAAKGPFPVAEKVTAKGINLPSSTVLTREQQEYIAQALIELRG